MLPLSLLCTGHGDPIAVIAPCQAQTFIPYREDRRSGRASSLERRTIQHGQNNLLQRSPRPRNPRGLVGITAQRTSAERTAGVPSACGERRGSRALVGAGYLGAFRLDFLLSVRDACRTDG